MNNTDKYQILTEKKELCERRPAVDRSKKKRFFRISRHQKALIAVFCILILIFVVLSERSFEKKAPEFARIAAERKVNSAVSESIAEYFSSLSPDESRLTETERDASGKIISVRTDAAKINLIRARLPALIEEKLSATPGFEIEVPSGSLFGLDAFSGRGKKITLSLCPVGSTVGQTESVFESCGINQTRHSVYIGIDVFVSVILPSGTQNAEFSEKVLITENIIFGEIPEVYVSR